MNLILKNILRTGLLLVALNTQGALVRVGDQAFVLGERSNQLIGVGLVSGLNTVGDKDPAQTRAALANTLRRFGINQSPRNQPHLQGHRRRARHGRPAALRQIGQPD